MDLELSGKTAMVTGGSRGIGFAVAEAFAAEGCHLHLVARDAAGLDTAKAQLVERFGVRVDVHPTDLSKVADREAVVAACGSVDILVNNAGAIPVATIADLDSEPVRTAFEAKLFGHAGLIKSVYARMCAQGSGVIANVMGTNGFKPAPNTIASGMANGALATLTIALGADAPSHGVRVFGVNPGATATARLVAGYKQFANNSLGDPDRWEELTHQLPFGRTADPREVAEVIVFLCSARASYVSGTSLTIDGGFSARG